MPLRAAATDFSSHNPPPCRGIFFPGGDGVNGYYELFLQTGAPLFYTMAKKETSGSCAGGPRSAAETDTYGG